jgi:hypothetical protein
MIVYSLDALRSLRGCVWALALPHRWSSTVAAGGWNVTMSPVRWPMPRGQIGQERIASATLAAPDGKSIPAQWTGPSLASSAAGECILFCHIWRQANRFRLKGTLSTTAPSSRGRLRLARSPRSSTGSHVRRPTHRDVSLRTAGTSPRRQVEFAPTKFSITSFLRGRSDCHRWLE